MTKVVNFKGKNYKVDFYGYVVVLTKTRDGNIIDKPVKGRLASRIRTLKRRLLDEQNRGRNLP